MRSQHVHSARSLDDSIVIDQVEAYREALLQGLNPDRRQLLRQFPEIADQLAACLNAIEIVGQLAPQVRQQIAESGDKIAGHPGLRTESLGDFRILHEIGRGGMGVVYEAEQLSLSRRVAVKVLPFASLWSETALHRFRKEVRLAAMLEHAAHIVPIYTVGCERGVHFYAMKLVDGCSLADVIRQRRQAVGRGDDASSPGVTDAPPAAEVDTCVADVTVAVDADGDWHRAAARVGLQAAEALAFAHQQGIVHRDVKPSNLLFDREGRLYVSDFGLARLEADVSLTRTGDILGTPRYMSPEQASGNSKVLDQRTDVYSLGATLYELLTLEPVIPGRDRAETMQALDRRRIVPPRVHDPHLPRPLERIVLKCLQRNPADRYASARELADDLARFLEHEQVHARPLGATRQVLRWIERYPATALVMTVVSVCCLLVAIGFGMILQRGQGSPETRGSPLSGLPVSPFAPSNSSPSGESPPMLRSSEKTRPSRPPRARRLLLEQLEDRRLLTTTPGLPWLETAELTASSDFQSGDTAGKEVAISGDTIVISSDRDDDAGFDAGAAYVYLRDDAGTPSDPEDDTWLKQAKLTLALQK